MAIEFRSIATSSYQFGHNDPVVNAPAGLTDGDLIIAIVQIGTWNDGGSATPGWTRLVSLESVGYDSSLYVQYKIAASEPSSWTFTDLFSGAGEMHIAAMAFSGVDQTTPLDVAAVLNALGSVTSGGKDTSPITPVSNNCMVLSIFQGDPETGISGTVDSSPACTERLDFTLNANGWIYVQDHLQTTAAEEAHTVTPNQTLYLSSILLALRPAAASGGADTAKKRMSATHLLMPGFPMAILPD